MQYSQPSLVGVYGWRKRSLYSLVLGMAVVTIVNLGVTIMLLNSINLSLGGLGYLKITPSGVELRDSSYVLGPLVASHLSSRHKEPLTFESYYNMSLIARDADGQATDVLHLWSSTQEPNRYEVTAYTEELQVNDQRGRTLFSARDGQVNVDTDVLHVLDGGAQFKGSVQTSMVHSGLGTELMLESTTRMLHVSAPNGVSIESRAADISASCLTGITLSSTEAKIKLKAPGIYIPFLESIPLLKSQASRYFQLDPGQSSRSFQMCMCNNGKLFVSPPNGECRVDNDSLQCR